MVVGCDELCTDGWVIWDISGECRILPKLANPPLPADPDPIPTPPTINPLAELTPFPAVEIIDVELVGASGSIMCGNDIEEGVLGLLP